MIYRNLTFSMCIMVVLDSGDQQRHSQTQAFAQASTDLSYHHKSASFPAWLPLTSTNIVPPLSSWRQIHSSR